MPRPMTSLRDRASGWTGLLALASLLGLQLALLTWLPYSRASLSSASVGEALAPADPLALGDLKWHREPYATAPELAPIRAVVIQHCPGLTPLATAICLSNLFARSFRFGMPDHEFLERQHDPAAQFAKHLAGQPGHCVSRSAMLATALLSVGIPGRVVQLLAARSDRGHTVAEVWDEGQWKIVDPSIAGFVKTADGQASAVAVTRSQAAPRWQRDSRLLQVPGTPDSAEENYAGDYLREGAVVFPEPWLYTRVGPRLSVPPLNGRFVVVASTSLRLGPAQRVLQIGIPLTLLALVVLASRLAWQLARRQRRVRRLAEAVAAEGFAAEQSGQSTS